MSVYAQNLLEQLVAAGHDVTMVSQYRGDPLGTRVYGGGPPPPVPGVKVIGLEQRGEQDGGDFERDIAEPARGQAVAEERGDRRGPYEAAQVPRQREQVAPPPSGVQQRRDEPVDILLRNVLGEGLHPVASDCLGVRVLWRRRAEVLEGGELASEVFVVEGDRG